jgi:hypothetical protein
VGKRLSEASKPKNDKEASLLMNSQILGRRYLRDGGQKSEDSSETAKIKNRAKVIGQRVLMSAGIGILQPFALFGSLPHIWMYGKSLSWR